MLGGEDSFSAAQENASKDGPGVFLQLQAEFGAGLVGSTCAYAKNCVIALSLRHQHRDDLAPVPAVDVKVRVQGEDPAVTVQFTQTCISGWSPGRASRARAAARPSSESAAPCRRRTHPGAAWANPPKPGSSRAVASPGIPALARTWSSAVRGFLSPGGPAAARAVSGRSLSCHSVIRTPLPRNTRSRRS